MGRAGQLEQAVHGRFGRRRRTRTACLPWKSHAAAVVEELPGQRQQFGGGFPRGGLGLLGRAFGQIAIHLDGKAAFGAPESGGLTARW